MKPHPYEISTLVTLLKNRLGKNLPLRLAILDIDNTFSGDKTLVNETRKRLEDLGYAIIFASTRTEELMMTELAYKQSVLKHDFKRPQPHSGFVNNQFVNADPVTIIPEAHLDPEIIIGSTGTQIYIRQPDGGYREDRDYTMSFGLPSETWRKLVLSELATADPSQTHFSFATIEDPTAYTQGRIDVAPPLYQIKVHFKSLQDKQLFREELRRSMNRKKRLYYNYLDDSSPEKSHYKGYFVPRPSTKKMAVTHLLKRITFSLGVEISDFEILIAGDSFPDYDMGNEAGMGARVTFLVVGASRLTPIITEKREEFAGEPIYVWQSLTPSEKPGEFIYETTVSKMDRRIILGDIRYPGTIAVETIAAYVKSH